MNKDFKNRRRNYFIKKGFQTRFILRFCGLVILGCIIFGAVLYIFSSKTLTTSFENSRLVIKSTKDFIMPAILFALVFVTILIGLATIVVTLLISHQLAGPLYRFERHLESIGKGDLWTQVKIRKKDELQVLADGFNKMTQAMRSGILQVKETSAELDKLIENLKRNVVKDESLKKLILELKISKENLDKAISYFKIEP